MTEKLTFENALVKAENGNAHVMCHIACAFIECDVINLSALDFRISATCNLPIQIFLLPTSCSYYIIAFSSLHEFITKGSAVLFSTLVTS